LEIAYDMQHNIRHIAHDIFDLRNELRVIDIIGNTVRGARKVGLLVLRRASGLGIRDLAFQVELLRETNGLFQHKDFICNSEKDELRRVIVNILRPVTNLIVEAVGSIETDLTIDLLKNKGVRQDVSHHLLTALDMRFS
jgi:hypothetical protein